MGAISAALGAAVLVTVVGCSAGSSGPSRSSGPSSSKGSAGSWYGTDLLWDAIGDADGFTAVGNSGVVVTSSDGHSWQQQPAVSHQTLRGIAEADGSVVAVGTGGTVVSWPRSRAGDAAVHASGVDVPLLGVAHGDGLWVVGGSSGVVLTSSDLRHWTPRSSGTDGDIFDIAYGAGRFVAVTDIGSIVTSTDGITWRTTRAPDGLWFWGAAFGPGGFIVSGANGTILQSPDGLSWTKRATGTNQVLRGVAYGRGGYLAVGSDAAVVSSTDGVVWTLRPTEDVGVELWRPAATAQSWLAVGAGGTRLVSSNLTSWIGNQTTRTAFYGLGSGGGVVLAAGVNGTVARYAPHGSWSTMATAPGRRELRSVGYLGSTWLATGGGGTILTSANGASFVPRNSLSGAELWSAAAVPGRPGARLVVVGAGGALLVSDDLGVTWRAIPDPQKETLFSVAAGPAGLVAVGVDGAAVRSADGLRWTTVRSGPGQTLRAVAADGERYVAVGASGTVLSSKDGANWTVSAPVTRVTLRAVAKIGNTWLAVGGGGVVIRSADLRSWKVIQSGTDSELFALASLPSSCAAIAVAGGDASIITKDCGLTWTPQA